MIRGLACVLLVLSPQERPPVEALLDKLRDDSIEVRDRAADDLVELGREALPLVEKLRRSPDPELRAQALSIRRAIERQETLRRFYRRAPRITLEREGAPLADLLTELAVQSGEGIVFDPARFQDRVSVRLREATFWEGLGELCRVAPALDFRIDEQGIGLVPEKRPPLPSVRRGEFTVWIDGLYLTRDFEFTGTPRDSFAIGLNAAWQTGVSPISVFQRITEVRDDRGNDLVLHDRMGQMPVQAIPKGRTQRYDFRSFLQVPGAGVRRLANVRGYVLFLFPTVLEESEIDLKAGQNSVQLGTTSVSLRNLRNPKGSCSFELILTFPPGSADALTQRPFADLIFVTDDNGGEHKVVSSARSISYSSEWVTRYETANVTLPEGRTAVKIRLRMMKETIEKKVDFDFRDLPLE